MSQGCHSTDFCIWREPIAMSKALSILGIFLLKEILCLYCSQYALVMQIRESGLLNYLFKYL